MKITDVKARVIETESPMSYPPPKSQALYVNVQTDEGIEGHYLVGRGRSNGRGLVDAVIEVLKPMIIGKDPYDREYLWHMMLSRSGMGGVPMLAVGSIDVCLWDIAGKAAGLPIYKVLGGYRDKIRAYASITAQESLQRYQDFAKELVAKGYTAIKLHVMGTPQDHIATCSATREAVGDDIDLLLDSNCRYDRREALWVGRELEKLGYYWYEEPLPNTDIEGYKELCRILDIPVAATETMEYAVPAHFTPYMREPIADILRTDAERGITLAKKLTDMCDAFGLKCELHGWGYATCQFANIHVNGATRASDFVEKMEPGELYNVCVKNSLEIDDEGYIHMPTGPGLGLEFDFDELDRRTLLSA